MYKLVTIAVIAIVVIVNGDTRYPADLNPALCPGYPNCDNALLALYLNGVIPAPPPPPPGHPPQPPAARYPADVNPSTCPNYPYCNNNSPGAGQPLPGFTQRLYPDGVAPAACPDYPFC